jgi:hypothetical protein
VNGYVEDAFLGSGASGVGAKPNPLGMENREEVNLGVLRDFS